jgi:hypothetical protein
MLNMTAMPASVRLPTAAQQMHHGPDVHIRAVMPSVFTPKSAHSTYNESHTSMPPCLVQARFRSAVLVKKPSWQRAEECG